MTWRVDPDDHHIWLYPDNSDDPWRLDPGEAWDLGDDLIIAATELLPHEPVGFTTMPPWMDHIQVAIASSNRLALVCNDHGAIHYPGMRLPLNEMADLARAHWAQQHKEGDHEERSDGGSDETVRGGDETAAASPDVHDPAA